MSTSFTDELKRPMKAFGLDIPAKNGADEWALPISATYVIASETARSSYAYTDPDYRDRADPQEVLRSLKAKAVAA